MNQFEILNNMINELHEMRETVKEDSPEYIRFSRAINALSEILNNKLDGV